MSALRIHTKEKKLMCFEIALQGRLDSDTYQQLQRTVDRLFEASVKGLQFDLRELDYISSMGIRVILAAAKLSKKKGVTLAVYNMQPQIKKIFDIAKALPAQSIFASIEEADRYFDKMQKQALEQG